VPWFIFAFLLLAASRSFGLIPEAATGPVGWFASFLTIVPMAALGLGVDVRVLASVGSRVTFAITESFAMLLAISLILIRILGVG